tara:strand:- start:18 stop:422 length:405 start_codon:yes stop_codon:yes gene_type:complete
MTLTKHREDVKEYILNQLKDELQYGDDEEVMNCDGAELPDRFLNENYFIIGTLKAKQWLGAEAFEAIETIQEYEQDNFGETFTDVSDPEKVANMLSYVLGYEILNDSEALSFRWNSPVNKNTIELIIKELELRK